MVRTRTSKLALAALMAIAVASTGFAREVMRLDASSTAAAQKSFGRMNSQFSQKRRQDLAIVVKFNLIG
ncbi:MAG TPA: hypothetical protein VGC55_09745, partial [Dokdonella sp.]